MTAKRSSRTAGKRRTAKKPKGPDHYLAVLCDAVLSTARAAGLPDPAPRTDATPKADVDYINAQQALVKLRIAARSTPSAELDRLQALVREAMRANGLTVRPVSAVYETADSITTLSRVCASALHTVNEQKTEIERLKLLLDTTTTGVLDAQLLDLLKQVSMHDRVDRVLLVHGPDAGKAIWVDLCVRQDSTVLPYKRARFGASTLHEAAASLLHDIDPNRDVTGMCDGLRKLHAPRCSTCGTSLRHVTGGFGNVFVTCDPCGNTWSFPDLSLVETKDHNS